MYGANIAVMKLSSWLSFERGRGATLAREIGVSPVMVSQWASGPRVAPIERCVPIERATSGEVTRRDLRPDDWAAIWPELADNTPQIQPQASAGCAFGAAETVATQGA